LHKAIQICLKLRNRRISNENLVSDLPKTVKFKQVSNRNVVSDLTKGRLSIRSSDSDLPKTVKGEVRVSVNDQHQIALIAERNALARTIISLEGVARAGLMVREPPQAIALLQTEILSMRARVREIDRAIKQKHSNVG
jgi:hypothetical protein